VRESAQEQPLPQVPVVLLCAEDDDLELISFVHEARQHGLEPEVVPGVETSDEPFLDAMSTNDAALFVVLRSDNLTAERILALKRAFSGAQKRGQHLLALRLEPERAATAVKTIARRLRQLMGPRSPAAKAKPRPAPAKPQEEDKQDIDEWAGTLIHEKGPAPPAVAPTGAARVPEPPGTDANAPEPAQTRASPRPAAREPTPIPGEHTWSGTLIADDADAPPLDDGDRTPLPDVERMPAVPAAAADSQSTLPSDAQWGGTLIAEPTHDVDLTLPQASAEDLNGFNSARSGWHPAIEPPSRSRIGLTLVVCLFVAGGLATAYAMQKSDRDTETPDTQPASERPVDASEPTSPAPRKTRRAAPAKKAAAAREEASPSEPRTSTARDERLEAADEAVSADPAAIPPSAIVDPEADADHDEPTIPAERAPLDEDFAETPHD
jgi:hypothetical protein